MNPLSSYSGRAQQPAAMALVGQAAAAGVESPAAGVAPGQDPKGLLASPQGILPPHQPQQPPHCTAASSSSNVGPPPTPDPALSCSAIDGSTSKADHVAGHNSMGQPCPWGRGQEDLADCQQQQQQPSSAEHLGFSPPMTPNLACSSGALQAAVGSSVSQLIGNLSTVLPSSDSAAASIATVSAAAGCSHASTSAAALQQQHSQHHLQVVRQQQQLLQVHNHAMAQQALLHHQQQQLQQQPYKRRQLVADQGTLVLGPSNGCVYSAGFQAGLLQILGRCAPCPEPRLPVDWMCLNHLPEGGAVLAEPAAGSGAAAAASATLPQAFPSSRSSSRSGSRSSMQQRPDPVCSPGLLQLGCAGRNSSAALAATANTRALGLQQGSRKRPQPGSHRAATGHCNLPAAHQAPTAGAATTATSGPFAAAAAAAAAAAGSPVPADSQLVTPGDAGLSSSTAAAGDAPTAAAAMAGSHDNLPVPPSSIAELLGASSPEQAAARLARMSRSELFQFAAQAVRAAPGGLATSGGIGRAQSTPAPTAAAQGHIGSTAAMLRQASTPAPLGATAAEDQVSVPVFSSPSLGQPSHGQPAASLPVEKLLDYYNQPMSLSEAAAAARATAGAIVAAAAAAAAAAVKRSAAELPSPAAVGGTAMESLLGSVCCPAPNYQQAKQQQQQFDAVYGSVSYQQQTIQLKHQADGVQQQQMEALDCLDRSGSTAAVAEALQAADVSDVLAAWPHDLEDWAMQEFF